MSTLGLPSAQSLAACAPRCSLISCDGGPCDRREVGAAGLFGSDVKINASFTHRKRPATANVCQSKQSLNPLWHNGFRYRPTVANLFKINSAGCRFESRRGSTESGRVQHFEHIAERGAGCPLPGFLCYSWWTGGDRRRTAARRVRGPRGRARGVTDSHGRKLIRRAIRPWGTTGGRAFRLAAWRSPVRRDRGDACA
jgi:hypothetical protein